jgi:hypothetical protein
MPGGRENLLLPRHLDDPPEIHHRHPVRDMLHHGEVVRDEEIGKIELPLEIAEQVDDLRLDRDVERRDRLVAHHELGVGRQRARNPNALALPAREFVRVSRRMVARQPHQPHELPHARPPLRPPADPVHLERLLENFPNRHPRIERGERVLEDDLHALPEPPQRLALKLRDVLSAEPDRPRGRRNEPEHEPRRRRFPAPRFAHQRQRLPPLEREGNPVHRTHHAKPPRQQHPALHRKILGQA